MSRESRRIIGRVCAVSLAATFWAMGLHIATYTSFVGGVVTGLSLLPVFHEMWKQS